MTTLFGDAYMIGLRAALARVTACMQGSGQFGLTWPLEASESGGHRGSPRSSLVIDWQCGLVCAVAKTQSKSA